MRREDILEFANRDRTSPRDLKAAHWRNRRREFGPAEGLRATDMLRAHMRAVRPEWPRPQDRDTDLADHTSLAETLRRVATVRDR